MASTPQTPTTPYQLPPRRRSLFGPIMLISIGAIFLLVNGGIITAKSAFILFAKYWPALLIVWGVVKLLEHLQARREGIAAPGIGAGGVIGLIFLVLFGLSVSAAYRGSQNVNWGNLRNEMQIDNDEFGRFFGQKFEFTDNLEQAFPANATLKVVSDSGDIKLSPSTDGKLHIAVRKVVYADSQGDADKIAKNITPTITLVDNVLNVDATRSGDRNAGGSLHMEIMAPKKAYADLMSMRGVVEIKGRDAAVKVHSGNGDITLEEVAGNADVHMRKGDLIVRKVTGNVEIEGRMNDINISDVTGSANLQGDVFGSIEFSKIAKGMRFKSSRTDLEIPKVDGTVTLDNGELRGNNLGGPVRLDARSYDVHLEDVSNDIRINNSRGEIELHPKAPLGNIEVTNKQGRIHIVVPANGGYLVDARARRGEIENDFDLSTTNDNREAHTTGTINKGGMRMTLNNDNGTIEIRKQ